MKSMTGYGKAAAIENGRELIVELKSVNNRFLDINSRLPRALSGGEDIIRKAIQEKIKRGSIDVYCSYTDKSDEPKNLIIDLSLAKAYVSAVKKMRTEFLLEDDFGVTALLRTQDIVKPDPDSVDQEAVLSLLKDAAKKAVDALDGMRAIEGETIKKDLSLMLKNIEKSLSIIIIKAPEVVNNYRNKITERMKEVLSGIEVDQARLLNEVAFFCDKVDINEELNRLKSHIAQFESILNSKSETGKKLDFISQEMLRETNTIGSKCNDLQITENVVSIKNEIEKIKEQIRNVE